MLGPLAGLGEKLGPLLIQLPPNFRADPDRIQDLLSALPPGTRAAVEFRNRSWGENAEVRGAMADADQAWVIADDESGEQPPPDRAPITTSWGYLRMRGVAYSDESLAAWARWVQSQPWTDVFVYFKHEEDAAGPRLARRFEAAFNATGA